MTITLGNMELTTPVSQPRRMSMVIWGPSGSGKTTLAATAPRPILWLNFDPDGTSSLMDQEDILIADFSNQKSTIVEKFKSENCAGVRDILIEHEFKTVVFDSITSFGEMALKHAVTVTNGASIEAPTLQGYGKRNTYTMQGVMNVIKTTGAKNANVIFIAHEEAPRVDEVTGAIQMSIMIGGRLQAEIPIKLSEVWHLEDDGKKRKITIRSSRLKKPMKSRMFVASGDRDFDWNFNPEKWEGDTIEKWYKEWMANNGKKLELP
jgi:hypothetical protein